MTVNENNHKICSIPEACKELRLGRSRLYELLQKHPDTWQHLGGRAFVDVTRLSDYIGGIDRTTLYTIKAACAELGVCRTTLIRHRNTFGNAWHRISGRWFIDVTEILNSMDQRAKEGE